MVAEMDGTPLGKSNVCGPRLALAHRAKGAELLLAGLGSVCSAA